MDAYTLHIKNRLFSYTHPIVMAILNLTPDSFAFSYDKLSKEDFIRKASSALQDGADILDLGACSTRPHASEVTEEEEWNRLEPALRIVRERFPEAIISLDTFRASIARKAILAYQVDIINDVSGGKDPEMFHTIAELHTPYILTHMRGTPETMTTMTDYQNLLAEIIDFFQRRVDTLHQMGVSDIILDPGFGFAKTTEQNFKLLSNIHALQVFGLPILVGLSRKSMFFRTLDVTPQSSSALTATIVGNTIALQQGAAILRVHDVREAKDTITIYTNCSCV